MKKIYAFIVTLFVAVTLFAQKQEPYLWPISGAKSGIGIIYAPQSYIDKELNFAGLFITAKEGTAVVAPTDGTISFISLTYYISLTQSMSSGSDKSFDNSRELRKEKFDKRYDFKYFNGSITIDIGAGKKINISGLRGDAGFKTGQRIRRGDTLGYVAYSYHKIKEPSIGVSISQHSKSADPMSSFGIKSSFIPPGELKPINSLTKEQAKEDFEVYIACLKDAYPGLYKVIEEEELKKYVEETLHSINSLPADMPFDDFYGIIAGAVAKIHDSHIYLHYIQWRQKATSQPQLYIGWFNDTLICTNATKEYEQLIGRQILKINGMDADSAKKIVAGLTRTYDAKVQDYVSYNLAFRGFGLLFFAKDKSYDMSLEMADGEKLTVKGLSTKNGMPKYVRSFHKFLSINWSKDKYFLKMLNDSTAYIGLLSFQLNEVQVENIAGFIDSISKAAVPNLIFDVRNNGGGHVDVLEKLYSYVAGEPMNLQGYSKVNKRGGFEAFKYSMNYVGSDFDIFSHYEAREGFDGFYEHPQGSQKVIPDSAINYKGRLYILTNEYSVSAATLFPAMAIRNHRGVVVGRETSTAYHFMNAMKFADIRLPNSTITITIPLVELCFDTVVNERVPYGRGVIPDYLVPLTVEELYYENGDAILNYTLKLIEENKYLSPENPFAQQEEQGSKDEDKMSYTSIVVGGVIVVGSVAFLLSRKKSLSKSGRKES